MSSSFALKRELESKEVDKAAERHLEAAPLSVLLVSQVSKVFSERWGIQGNPSALPLACLAPFPNSRLHPAASRQADAARGKENAIAAQRATDGTASKPSRHAEAVDEDADDTVWGFGAVDAALDEAA